VSKTGIETRNDNVTKHILFVNSPPYLGGAEISLLELLRALDRQLYEPSLLTSKEGPLAQRARDIGVAVSLHDFPHFSRRRPWLVLGSVLRLVNLMRSRPVSLLVANSEQGLGQIMWACRLTGVPYLVYVRDAVRNWFGHASLTALQHARCVIANSRWIAKKCHEAGVDPRRITTIYPPVDVAAIRRVSEREVSELRLELQMGKDSIVIGTVGQIHPLKGQAEFLEAARTVAERVPSAIFCVVGSAMGPDVRYLEHELRAKVLQWGLKDRFRFTGFRTDVARIIHALDILVTPSYSESFGRVVVEGMAAGRAVVASECGGIPEIIEDGVTGILVPVGDARALADAIVDLCTDSAKRNRLGSNAWARAPDFGIAPHVEQMCRLFASMAC
jgi:glycosyltransferase involved in cell wall biosynthesis